MSMFAILFLLIPLLVVVLLVWAVRPPRTLPQSTDEVLNALSQDRHYCHMAQIQQALNPEDANFIRAQGRPDLAMQMQLQRRAIALRYIDALAQDYRLLLDASRMIAVLSPEVKAMDEWELIKINARFSWKCVLLRCKLQAGLSPWAGFESISDMASQLTFSLESASSKMGELAFGLPEQPEGSNGREGA